MKRQLTIIGLLATLLLAFSLPAMAYPGGHGRGHGPCGMGQPPCQQLDEESKKKLDEFHQTTKELRRQMASKRAEYRALMQADNPDPDKAGKLAGELFDLRDEMHAKASEAGIKRGCGQCKGAMGPGPMAKKPCKVGPKGQE